MRNESKIIIVTYARRDIRKLYKLKTRKQIHVDRTIMDYIMVVGKKTAGALFVSESLFQYLDNVVLSHQHAIWYTKNFLY